MGIDDRRNFLGVLKRRLIPELRAAGFTGSGATYRRVLDQVIQVINIQGSRSGGKCCVNLGVHLRFLPTSLGDAPNIKAFDEPSCEFRRRLTREGESDHWWPYGAFEAEVESSVSDLVTVYRNRGASYFESWSQFPGQFTDLTLVQLVNSDLRTLPGVTTDLRAALAMARIHAHLGNHETAHTFAAFGLSNLGHATGMRGDFEEVIAKQPAAEPL